MTKIITYRAEFRDGTTATLRTKRVGLKAATKRTDNGKISWNKGVNTFWDWHPDLFVPSISVVVVED